MTERRERHFSYELNFKLSVTFDLYVAIHFLCCHGFNIFLRHIESLYELNYKK